MLRVGAHPTRSLKAMKEFYLWISENQLILFAILIYIAQCFWLCKFQKSLKLRWAEIYLVPLGHVAIGWTCMWLLALIEVGFDMEKAANMRLYGAILVLPLLYYLWGRLTKKNISIVMDMASICVIFGAISGRLNCFTVGCCQGVPIGNTRWPLREAEMVFYALFILIFAPKIVKGKTNGQAYPLYLLMYGTLRFLSEFVREEFTTQVGALHLAHIWSMIAIIAGAFFYLRGRKRIQLAKSR